MNKEKAIELLKKSDALLEGHFVLSSGNHSQFYVQCALLMSYPDIAKEFFQDIANHFANYKIDTVIAPAVGGIIVSYGVAEILGARSIFLERENGIFTLRRGFSVNKNEKILVVEDVITTGGSIIEVAKRLEDYGADVIAYASIVNRSSGRFNPDREYYYTVEMNFPIYKPEDCPLCKKGVPFIKPGSRGLK